MFPKCFPANFESEILPIKEDESIAIDVYRVIKSGEINRAAFLSTWEETEENLIDSLDKSDPGTYATSCSSSLGVLKRLTKRIMLHHPSPIIAKGTTEVSCGPSQKSKDRTQKNTPHVDWWVYDEAEPHLYFEEVKEESK